MTPADRAKGKLLHYFRLLAERSGLPWGDDNSSEVEEIVDEIIEAAREGGSGCRCSSTEPQAPPANDLTGERPCVRGEGYAFDIVEGGLMSTFPKVCPDCAGFGDRFAGAVTCATCNGTGILSESPSEPVTGNHYQAAAARTLVDSIDFHISDNDLSLAWNALGLAGEAGEVADLVKKSVFHQKGLKLEDLVKELGDVLWYIAAICSCTGLNIEDVMSANIAKLRERYPDGWSVERSHAHGEAPTEEKCRSCKGSGIEYDPFRECEDTCSTCKGSGLPPVKEGVRG